MRLQRVFSRDEPGGCVSNAALMPTSPRVCAAVNELSESAVMVIGDGALQAGKRLTASDQLFRWGARLGGANAAAHQYGWRFERSHGYECAHRTGNGGKACTESEVRGEARAVHAVRNDGTCLRQVVVVSADADDGMLRAGCVTEFDRDRTARAGDTRIADDRRQYVEYHRQPHEADPVCRTFHRYPAKVSAQYSKGASSECLKWTRSGSEVELDLKWSRSGPEEVLRTIDKFYSRIFNGGTSVPIKQQQCAETLVFWSTALVANGD
ncbi:hypothetical protein PBS_47610 [Paraburkholderia sp. 2C]